MLLSLFDFFFFVNNSHITRQFYSRQWSVHRLDIAVSAILCARQILCMSKMLPCDRWVKSKRFLHWYPRFSNQTSHEWRAMSRRRLYTRNMSRRCRLECCLMSNVRRNARSVDQPTVAATLWIRKIFFISVFTVSNNASILMYDFSFVNFKARDYIVFFFFLSSVR